ncbi:TIGR02117 family protein [Altericista sp. CCNU0014]|uniref:TIGR02117 family protein n=1 Tax=Altericista sp. CCNU0014 TaxID=3082949 RepID=UPI00384BAAB8
MRERKHSKACCYGLLSCVFVLLALLLGCLLPTQWHYRAQSDCSYSIYISSVNHFHAEAIVPVTTAAFDWRSRLSLSQLGPNADKYRYLSFGWGDRQFFMNASFHPIAIFDTLFLPGPTVMHVWGHAEKPDRLPPAFEVKQIWLSRTEYLKLMQFIDASFKRDTQGNPRYIRQGLYADSGFYEAIGSYSIARTCNTWTADALRRAGVNTPVWTALAPAIMHHLRSNCNVGY